MKPPRIHSLRFPALAAAIAALFGQCFAAPVWAAPGDQSPDGLWTEVDAGSVPRPAPIRFMGDQAFRVIAVDEGALEVLLSQAPLELTARVHTSNVVITLPMPDGSFARFRIVESPILSADLAAQHPELKTYLGQGIDDQSATARFDRTPAGFHAQILSANAGGTVLVDPYAGAAPGLHLTYWKSAAERDPAGFTCLVTDASGRALPMPSILSVPSGDNLRTYRLAMTATGEYTTFFGGVPQAQAAITTTVNRVTGIYELEVAIRLNLTAFNIYDDPATDPFPTGDTVDEALLNQNQDDLDANVGSDNYDIGHIVSQGGGGGLAGVEVVCDDDEKGRGGTSWGNPAGDPFDVDYVAHEIGHQFAGRHTFNGTTLSCGGGNRFPSAAYEPGSGTTIMAYAGICGGENVQPNSDPYFHTYSFDQITAYRDGDGDCGVQTTTGNTVPTVDAGADFTIPQDTPFILTASGSDADGDALTYCWEQFDLGDPSPPPNNANGPLFRSRLATSSPSRTLPRLVDILSGAPTPWEILPTVDRALNFRCTVRDNRAGGGGVNYDAMVVTVSGAPFEVVFPNGGENVLAGAATTVTWDVGGGDVADNVNILLTRTGGLSFTLLVANTPNDGSQSVDIPCGNSPTAFIKIEPVGNIFFDISDAPFTIRDKTPPEITCPDGITVECSETGGTPATDPAIQAFLNGASATDICDASPEITTDAPPFFPDGETLITFTATDNSGNTDTCTATVTVVDTTPPTIAVTLSRCVLWPPNHRLVTINATVVVDDICDADPTFVLASITSDEPDNGLGDGDRPDDIQGEALGTPDIEFQLRSERQGGGDGREYTIVYTATDDAGLTATHTDVVTVPHDQGGHATGGSGYNQTGTDFDPAATTYVLVILSTPSLDATTVDGSGCLVGNHMAVIHPTEHELFDVDGDQHLDLLASFETSVTRVLRQTPDEEGLYPVGLRYEGAEGTGYWVADIFALGPPIEVETIGVDAEDVEGAPIVTRLGQPQPNPFTETTRVPYSVGGGTGQWVEIGIYNVAGQRVRTLTSGLHAPGEYAGTWDGRNDNGGQMPAGVYFYNITIGGETAVRRVALMR